MARVPDRLLEGTRLLDESTEGTSGTENDEDNGGQEGSVRTILDANERPAKACKTEEMDWSDNLSGTEALISGGPTGMLDVSTERSSPHVEEAMASVRTVTGLTDSSSGMLQVKPIEGRALRNKLEQPRSRKPCKGGPG